MTASILADRPGCPARRHDTAGAYQTLGCRCPPGREADRLYRKRRREGRLPDALVDSTGTIRRIDALRALGWTAADIGGRCGWPRNRVRMLRKQPSVHRDTAASVLRLYEEWSMTPGPSSRTRAMAARQGCMPPLAWEGADMDDPAAVPDLGGPDKRSSVTDLDEFRHLVRCGESAELASRRVGRSVDALRLAASRDHSVSA